MSLLEEPAAKVSKLSGPRNTEDETEDDLYEGQEEWLSEEVLTDEDEYQVEALDNTLDSLDTPTSPVLEGDGNNEDETEDIERALNNMQNSQQNNTQGFLAQKKTESDLKDESDLDVSMKSDDDGNDTDELLRMLGEDNSKPVTKTAKSQVKKKPVTDDDEEVRPIRTRSKFVKLEKKATKAVPEDMSDDEVDIKPRPRTRSKVMMKSREQKAIAKDISGGGGDMDSTSADDASALKKMFVSNKKKDAGNDKQTSNGVKKNTSGNKSTTTANKNVKSNQNMALRNRDDKDMDSEDVSLDMQSLMKPEEMDEEVPSDCETESEADSLYDDFPTTDSEDMNEWFTLDIREERAGDYIPLLGSKAVQLLSEEKQRVLDRLSSLRESLSVMSETGKDQTELLKKATATLSELDAALKFA
ncbi:uncharacterized protein LOC126973324 [Leptidea sinapis]|uniref:uncharacterized protein LOC126973324 n=1 Tax=Leptidea sinapis TaxID=189913 RepID=UPI002130870B|nr:uncharacterized protein LOC126973324 [Leptidea sinapis]XP_050676499.1 uncharacterized protein LOC126973324 [Leptidea sinapis]